MALLLTLMCNKNNKKVVNCWLTVQFLVQTYIFEQHIFKTTGNSFETILWFAVKSFWSIRRSKPPYIETETLNLQILSSGENQIDYAILY